MDSEVQGKLPQKNSQPDIKRFITRMHNRIDNVKSGMSETHQSYKQLQSSLKSMETQNKDETDEIHTKILEDVQNLEVQLRQIQEESKSDVSFLKQQIGTGTQEFMKMEQDVLLLGSRVKEIESLIGAELTLPDSDQD